MYGKQESGILKNQEICAEIIESLIFLFFFSFIIVTNIVNHAPQFANPSIIKWGQTTLLL